jgi:hypothetical protein
MPDRPGPLPGWTPVQAVGTHLRSGKKFNKPHHSQKFSKTPNPCTKYFQDPNDPSSTFFHHGLDPGAMDAKIPWMKQWVQVQ